MKANIKKHISTRKGYKKGLVAAAAVVVSIGVLSSTPIMANMVIAIESIAGHMGIEKNLEDYTTIVGEGITKRGVTITLNEVILNNDELLVSTTASADEKLEEMGMHYFTSVYINNELVSSGGSGGSWHIDEYTEQSIMTSLLTQDDLQGELEVKLVFDGVRVNNKRKLGRWVFEFQTTGDKLSLETESVEVGYEFEITDGVKITIDRIDNNKLGPKIYFHTNQDNGVNYDLLLKGEDNLGNTLEFYMSHYSPDEGGMMKLNFVNDELVNVLSDGVQSLTLTPYAVAFPEESGKLSNDFKAVGEPFTINLE